MHRSALALGTPSDFAEKLRHAFIHPHANREGMPVIPIGGDHVVILAHQRRCSNRDGFLPDVEMQKPAHFAKRVVLVGCFLKPPNSEHLAHETDFVLRCKISICGVAGERAWHFAEL